MNIVIPENETFYVVENNKEEIQNYSFVYEFVIKPFLDI